MSMFYISKNYRDRYTASSKAKLDCELIVQSLGFINIGLPVSFSQNSYLGRLKTVLSNKYACLRMPKNSIAFLQYPVYGYKDQVNRCLRQKNKIITVIHDLNALRGITQLSDFKVLESSDVLIVHTQRMKEWCLENLRVKHIVVLELFDYLYDKPRDREVKLYDKNRISVAFAGNLSKSAFLDHIHLHQSQLNLFGIGIDRRQIGEGCVYQGCFPPNELYKYLNSMFGLVWDGDTVETCTGVGGKYLRYIIPHKISMYLSCGMPVIVWSQSAMADFVRKEHIGLVVDSIGDMDTFLQKVSVEDYKQLCAHVQDIRDKVISGFYLSDAIAKSLKLLNC